MRASRAVGQAEGHRVGEAMRPWAAVGLVLVAINTPSAHADVAPSPPEACAERAHGDRCFDALGRPGRCVPEKFSAGRCAVGQEAETPPTASASAAPSSEPQVEPQSSGNRSGGCAAPPEPLLGGTTWIVAVFALLVTRQRRRRRSPASY